MLNPVNFTDLGPKRLLHVRQVLVAFQVPAAAQRVHVLLVDLGDLVVPVEVRTPNGEPVEHRGAERSGEWVSNGRRREKISGGLL